MRTRSFLPQSLVILFIFAIASSACGDRSTKNIRLADLLVDNGEMPPQWTFTEISDVGLEGQRSRDSVAISFNSDLYPDSYYCNQNVYRFKSGSGAERDFKSELSFYERYYYIPTEWEFASSVASESYVSCKDNVFPVCVWIARYNNIVIEFQAPLIPERLSLNDMENIVKNIDLKTDKIINHP